MVVPNTRLIAEIILFSNGFREAQILAFKIQRLFDYLNDQLKFCSHYDFGLRTIKTILITAGQMKLRAISVKTEERIRMDQADHAIQNYFTVMAKVQREKVTSLDESRGTMDFQRQKLLKKKKETDVEKLV